MKNNKNVATLLMIISMLIFSVQDALSKYLASEYNVLMIVMFRYWFFAFFSSSVFMVTKNHSNKKITKTLKPVLQTIRSLLLVAEVCVLVFSFTFVGLIESHAIFAVYPLITILLSVIFLGEKNTLKGWIAVCLGFLGVVIILGPEYQTLSLTACIPLASAAMFATYTILTRKVAETDSAETSFAWTGLVGALSVSLFGVFYFEPIKTDDLVWLSMLCLSAVSGHFLFIKALKLAEASTLQPFAYFQLLFTSLIGVLFFNEEITATVIFGALMIVSGGLLTFTKNQGNKFR